VSVSGIALGRMKVPAAVGETNSCPIAVFSKVYQELNLSFAEAASVTAEAGLSGVDCPVRAGGEISPEKAGDQLPRYAETLGRLNLRLWLLTTGITSASSPYAEAILRTAKQLGIKYYRLGFVEREAGRSSGLIRRSMRSLKNLPR